MGQDLEGIAGSSFGQPLAQIFFNSFGQKGTLIMWSFIIIAQYMMGSSIVSFCSSFPLIGWADNHFRCLLRHAKALLCRSQIPATQRYKL